MGVTNKREWMIETIQKKYGLYSPEVFEAMRQVPREMFVPNEYREEAYEDNPIPIGYGQTISQPFTVAFMADLLKLDKNKRVLEVGTGSGYHTAVMALMAKHVYSIEIIEELALDAERRLIQLEFNNVSIKVGQGEEGWSEFAPYDAIVAAAEIKNGAPPKLLDQLKINGIFVAPINGELTQIIKQKNENITKTFGAFRFVPFVRNE